MHGWINKLLLDFDISLLFVDYMLGYMDLGPPSEKCELCGAIMWDGERNNKTAKNKKPTFSLCCNVGTVQLPNEKPPPDFLAVLLSDPQKSRFN